MIDALVIIIATIIVIIRYKKEYKKKDEVFETPEEQDTNNYRAITLKADKENEKITEYKKQIDIRQFARRNNVTCEEVIDYIIAHKRYEGWININYILEAISNVCNINEDDLKEIKKYLWKNVPFNESEEKKTENEYMKERQRKLDRQYQEKEEYLNDLFKGVNADELWNKMEHPKVLDEAKEDKIKMTYYYEDWLKEKGYI